MKKEKLLKAQKAGGRAVKKKYGIEYFRKLGSRGGKKSAAVRWGWGVDKLKNKAKSGVLTAA